jgi:hypothetical protein
LNVVATTSREELTLPTNEIRQYALQGWSGGVLSPASPLRTVRPHAPATVARVTFPGEQTLALTFTENLDPATRADQFVLDAGGGAAVLLLSEGGRTAVLRFEHPSIGRDTLRWHSVRDVEGTPVASQPVAVQFPVAAPEALIVARWDVPGPDRVRLTFNAPLDPALAVETANYQLSPAGRVVEARIAPENPAMVELQVEGQALGAVGQDVTLRLAHLRSATGIPLAPESSQLRLVQPANDLADVYLYPNPWQASRHPPQVIVAGLPTAATVRIYTLDGRLVQTLTERGGDGGAAWDLRDRRGEATPAGVYLIQVEAPGHPAVLRKLAVIR